MDAKLRKCVNANLHKGETLYEKFPILWGIYASSKTGEIYKYYYIEGVLKGEPAKANFKIADIGLYSLLDLVFKGADKVYLVRSVDGERGNAYNPYKVSYKAVSFDEDGFMTECPIVPREKSDITILNNLLSREDIRLKEVAKVEAEKVLADYENGLSNKPDSEQMTLPENPLPDNPESTVSDVTDNN